ncbi:MAG: L,D-transpeptidase family protein [Pseudomonadota bacterium]
MTKLVVTREYGNYFLNTPEGKSYPAAIGCNGLVAAEDKIEGDGKTPIGTWPVRELFYRADKVALPENIKLNTTVITKELGWCVDSEHESYNKLVNLAETGTDFSHENMWMERDVYDYVVPLGYNDNPPEAGRGSTIFFHLASADYKPTAGCIAISHDDMLEILPTLDASSTITFADGILYNEL